MKRRARDGEALEFFENVVVPFSGDDCLEWPYNTYSYGYGRLRIKGVAFAVHRLICAKVHGPPPTRGHQASHNCGNARCVNPRHIEWKTPAGNQADRFIHGTSNRGKCAVLSEKDAAAIYMARGVTSQRRLARQYAVSPSCISDIHSGRNWGWLTQTLASKGE